LGELLLLALLFPLGDGKKMGAKKERKKRFRSKVSLGARLCRPGMNHISSGGSHGFLMKVDEGE
jgi:hypothetical protein